MKRFIASILIGAVIVFGLPINAPVIKTNIAEKFSSVFTTPDACAAWIFRNFSGGSKTAVFSTMPFKKNYALDSGCVGAWRCNGASVASEIDRSSNGNTLALSGTMASSATVPTYYFGKSRMTASAGFNYLSRADGGSLDLTGTTMSISAWINPAAVVSFVSICGKYASSNAQYDLNLYGSKALFRVSADGIAQTGVETTNNISTSSWTHLVAVYNGTTIALYVNGALGSTPVAFSSSLFNGTGTFRIGANPGVNGMYGYTDEVGIFNRALSSTEILEIYTEGLFGDRGAND